MLFPPLLAPPALDVENVAPGETVRYPLLILRGTTDGEGIIAGTSWKAMVRFPTAAGRFAAAVRLKPGPNFVLLQSGRGTIKLQVVYRPMATPYRVRAVLLLAKEDEEPDATLRERFGLALEMMQSVAAESMREAGYGRRTFALERGPDGRAVVHIVRDEATGDALRALDGNALWSRFDARLAKEFDFGVDKACALMAFSRYDAAHRKALGFTALGGDGLALFGGLALGGFPASVGAIPEAFSDATPLDPTREFDDTGLRGVRWAAVATPLGAMLHELGHTFGLPHSADPRSLMSRGFDAFNRRFVAYESSSGNVPEGRAVGPEDASHYDPFEAARLAFQPWFQPEGYHGLRFPSALPPKIAFDGEEIVLSAPYGLGLVGAVREGQAGVFRKFKGEKLARLRRAELGEGAASLIVVDGYGNETDAKLP